MGHQQRAVLCQPLVPEVSFESQPDCIPPGGCFVFSLIYRCLLVPQTAVDPGVSSHSGSDNTTVFY